MTNQQIFDKVWAHIKQQGHASLQRGSCVYKAPNGDMCAVGCLLPSGTDTAPMEGGGVDSVLVVEKLDGKIVSKIRDGFKIASDRDLAVAIALDSAGLDWEDREVVRFLGSLQAAHDKYLQTSLDMWEGRMRTLAEVWGLVAPEAPQED